MGNVANYAGQVVRLGIPLSAKVSNTAAAAAAFFVGGGVPALIALVFKAEFLIGLLAACLGIALILILVLALGGYLTWQEEESVAAAHMETRFDALVARHRGGEDGKDFLRGGIVAAYENRAAARPSIQDAIASAKREVFILSWDLLFVEDKVPFRDALSTFLSRSGARLQICFYAPNVDQTVSRVARDYPGDDASLAKSLKSRLRKRNQSQNDITTS